MLDGKRKSIEPMAARLQDGDEQCLQQFVNQSPWRWEPVRQRLAIRMSAEISPQAWVIDDTGFPKFGDKSVGVARQYCGALGKIALKMAGLPHTRRWTSSTSASSPTWTQTSGRAALAAVHRAQGRLPGPRAARSWFTVLPFDHG
jgi:DDE superfamily endonuclease